MWLSWLGKKPWNLPLTNLRSLSSSTIWYLETGICPCAKHQVTRLYVIWVECDVNLTRCLEHTGRLPSNVPLKVHNGPVLGEVGELVLHTGIMGTLCFNFFYKPRFCCKTKIYMVQMRFLWIRYINISSLERVWVPKAERRTLWISDQLLCRILSFNECYLNDLNIRWKSKCFVTLITLCCVFLWCDKEVITHCYVAIDRLAKSMTR